MKKYYLAIDIGASSGRHILACMENGRIQLEEIYRFSNGNDISNGHLVWDMDRLFQEIKLGMKHCAMRGIAPVSMSIDTWGVDYVLLDQDDKRIGPCYGYRDSRTDGMKEKVYSVISKHSLYQRTGIQETSFNTIFQLMAIKEQNQDALNNAKSLLMVPDYLHFLLTGIKKQEYTNATTTQLINASTNTWDTELIDLLGLPGRLFGPLSMPGTCVGRLLPEIQEEVGFDTKVILPATHDTGAAVMSVPSEEKDILYISSGTWSLLGTELEAANTSEDAEKANFTNEGGYDYRFRFLKNIMGLWMIQSVKKELEAGYAYEGRKNNEDYGFANLCSQASKAEIDSIVDVSDNRFLAPDSMIAEVQAACREEGLAVPVTAWEIARVIYRSLAECYRKTILEVEALTGRHYNAINIVGGGSKAGWLNQLVADTTGRIVLAGPGEATAIGNLGAQMIADGVFDSLAQFRRSVFESFGVLTYHPAQT